MPPANDNFPLVLKRAEAAQFCAIAISTFDSWVRRGALPGPIRGSRRWSRIAIERALSDGIQYGAQQAAPALSPFEEWKRGNAG